jgi:hypothetical protein
MGDEAAKLLEALQQWLEGHGFAGRASSGSPSTPNPERCGCPVCRALTQAREARPEVLEHLSAAASEVLAALQALFDASGSQQGREQQGHGGVERIDVED